MVGMVELSTSPSYTTTKSNLTTQGFGERILAALRLPIQVVFQALLKILEEDEAALHCTAPPDFVPGDAKPTGVIRCSAGIRFKVRIYTNGHLPP